MNDIDDKYRQASAQDPSEPAESTRRNILAHAAKLAAQRAASQDQVIADFRRPAANQSSWRPALIGTLAAAGLAGLLVTPLFLSPRAPDSSVALTKLTATTPPVQVPAAAPDLSAAPPAPADTQRSMSERRQPDRKIEAKVEPATVNPRAQRFGLAPESQPVPSKESPAAFAEEAATTSNAERPAVNAAAAPPAQRSFAEPRAFVGGAIATDSARQKSASAQSVTSDPWAVALMQAAEGGDLVRMKMVLAGPVDINARDNLGRTALMRAILRGQSKAVNLLLVRGADANAADAQGTSPLQAALAGSHAAIAADLQRAGAR